MTATPPPATETVPPAADAARMVNPPAPVAPSPQAPEEPALPLSPGVVARVLGVMQREPVLFVTATYVLLSFFGLWSMYWYYRGFGVPILEYLQAADLFMAGLRRPQSLLVIALAFVVLWASSLPFAWSERHPARAAALRERHWWGAIAFPDPQGVAGLWGVRNATLLSITFLMVALYLLQQMSSDLARGLIDGKERGARVQLVLAGEAVPLPGHAQLLGTTGSYVFVRWPANGHVEALPVANLSRIVTTPVAAVKQPQPVRVAPAGVAAPAATSPATRP